MCAAVWASLFYNAGVCVCVCVHVQQQMTFDIARAGGGVKKGWQHKGPKLLDCDSCEPWIT